MSDTDELALEQAWRYFALHAEQRTTVFNFFAAAAGLIITGLAYVLGTKDAPAEFGLAAGIGALLLSLVFWKLDQRVDQLIKGAENVIIQIENRIFLSTERTFALSEDLPVNQSLLPFGGTWSYGRAFRILFSSVAAIGVLGIVMNAASLLLETPREKHDAAISPRVSVTAEMAKPIAGSIARNVSSPTASVRGPRASEAKKN